MSSGGNGGMFGPSVGIGGILGFIFAFVLNQTGWVHLKVTHFIVAGMAASVSGAMHAPLTGIFLAAEITGGYALIVPLMIVSTIAYLINKGIRKYSIYTLPLAQKGSLVNTENRDASVLSHMKLRYLVENDFVPLLPDDTPGSREEDIVHADRQAFPVVDKDGKLLGVIIVDHLLEHIVSDNPADKNIPVTHIMQQAIDKVSINTPMKDVL